MQKILVFIPTYNEADNVGPLYEEIKKLKLRSDILFVDDNSPDGTSKVISNIAKKDNTVKLIMRPGKKGIGSAHILGIEYAYKNRYKTLITLDADFTHKPEDILKLLSKRGSADIVVGSRYISTGSLADWNLLRKSLTIIAHALTKNLLNMPYDATGAFRLYNIDRIPKGVFSIVESSGYSFFFESLFILFLNGFSVKEVAIKLPRRTYGSSKMKLSDAWKSLLFLVQTFYLSKIYKDSYTYMPSLLPEKKLRVEGEDEWDEYWKTERKNRKVLYDSAATFYRKFIIKKTLNRYIKSTFKKGSSALHAGCGGGQVDEDLINYIKITALDISREALNRYKWSYGDKCKVVHGSIF
jgi:dolichol-phosphate mannosyltransferase